MDTTTGPANDHGTLEPTIFSVTQRQNTELLGLSTRQLDAADLLLSDSTSETITAGTTAASVSNISVAGISQNTRTFSVSNDNEQSSMDFTRGLQEDILLDTHARQSSQDPFATTTEPSAHEPNEANLGGGSVHSLLARNGSENSTMNADLLSPQLDSITSNSNNALQYSQKPPLPLEKPSRLQHMSAQASFSEFNSSSIVNQQLPKLSIEHDNLIDLKNHDTPMSIDLPVKNSNHKAESDTTTTPNSSVRTPSVNTTPKSAYAESLAAASALFKNSFPIGRSSSSRSPSPTKSITSKSLLQPPKRTSQVSPDLQFASKSPSDSPHLPLQNLNAFDMSVLTPQPIHDGVHLGSAASRGPLNALPPPLEPHLFTLPTRKWTDPTTFSDIPYTDLLGDAMAKLFINTPEIQRPARKIMTVDQAILLPNPYKVLIEANSWRSVAQLARSDIIASHPASVDRISRLWLLRWYALSRLKHIDLIQSEMDRMGDLESTELTFERFPDVWLNRQGPLASFELRLFCHLVPAMKGNHYESIHRMYKLLYGYRKHAQMHAQKLRNQDTSDATSVFESLKPNTDMSQPNVEEIDSVQSKPPTFDPISDWKRVQPIILIHIANLLVDIQDYTNASSIMQSLHQLNPDNLDIFAAMGRLHLQVGNLPSAKKVFLQIESKLGIPLDTQSLPSGVEGNKRLDQGSGAKMGTSILKSTILGPQVPLDIPRADLILSHRGMLCLAEGEYDQAISYFTESVTRSPLPLPILINNLALAQLYSGNVNQAASFLESLSAERPKVVASTPGLVFNLCTLYDLVERSLEKKRRFLADVVGVYGGDDFASENIKV
ncbi:Trafficking protein particle complex subunit 12 [Batrachochytrium dendrobatidis]|nr:Trafficking protein particle complex subunit 12 [Batrachochytrium dendrobatidis]KAK5670655.1 Trafficking protein particle complex subunit 12 [Batrachochytrium dendrobatidis]